MKKIIIILIIGILLVNLSGCNKRNVDEIDINIYSQTDVQNVSVSILDVSEIGATIIIKDTNKEPYNYTEWYKLQKLENGNWTDVKPIIENYGFNEIAYTVNDKNEVTFKMDWDWLYGKLPLGSYRIVKKVNNQFIYIEFAIATTSKK